MSEQGSEKRATRRSIQIAAIAEQIASCYDARYYDSLDEVAAEGNSGWTIDVAYGGEGPGNWTRTEGVVLTGAELEQAVALAERLFGE